MPWPFRPTVPSSRDATLDYEQAGDTGYEVGEATLAIATGTAVVKFVVVWKKVDGQWRLHRDIWNAKGASIRRGDSTAGCSG